MAHIKIVSLHLNFFCILFVKSIEYSAYISTSTDPHSSAFLYTNDYIYSSNGMAYLTLEEDGDCVIYSIDNNDTEIMQWHTATDNNQQTYAELKTDGDFIIYSSITHHILWSSNSSNGTMNSPYYLILNNDGYLYIVNKNNVKTWSSNNAPNNFPIFPSISSSDSQLSRKLGDLSDDDISLLVLFALCGIIIICLCLLLGLYAYKNYYVRRRLLSFADGKVKTPTFENVATRSSEHSW